jgi:CheY-like chemotaxis protein
VLSYAKEEAMRILILDDDDARHDIWRDSFTKAGHDVVNVHTIAEFEDAIAGPRFDLIFLDHDLNDFSKKYQSVTKGGYKLTGKAACHAIRTLTTGKQPRTVIIHSWNEEGALDMFTILMQDPLRSYNVKLKEFPIKLWSRHPSNRFESINYDELDADAMEW